MEGILREVAELLDEYESEVADYVHNEENGSEEQDLLQDRLDHIADVRARFLEAIK